MDTFLWVVSSLAQAGMAFLGFWLTVYPDSAQNYGKEFAAGFVALLIVALLASAWSFHRSSSASDAVALLTQQILYEVKGSPDGMLSILPGSTNSNDVKAESGEFTFSYYNDTDYPLMDASVGTVGTQFLEMPQYGRRLGDVRPQRGGTLPGFTVRIPKDDSKHYRIDFSIDSRSVTMWESMYFAWTGNGWKIDWTIYKEVDGRQVFLKDLRPNSPFAAEVAQRKQWDKENADQKEQSAKEHVRAK